MRSPRIIISGGGTGGHIFPAIAIADAIKAAEPNSEFLFVGAKGRMEMERVPKAGYPIKGLWISGIQRKLTMSNLSFPFKLVSSLLKARAIVKEFKPDVAVGVGGYASGPLLKVASAKKIPSLIQEQNSFPGITNRLLAAKVNTICVAYEGMDKWFPAGKIVMTGNPVREQVVQLAGKKDEGLAFFGLKRDVPTLLVVGGSLGARTINQTIHANLDFFKSNGFQLIWQTGKNYAAEAETAVKEMDYSGVVTTPFIDRMDLAYAAADALVSRAGAMSVSEICLIQKAAVLVPSPNVAEDHQTKNARALADSRAALLVTDKNAQNELIPAVKKLLSDETYREEIARNTANHAFQNSAENIANEVLKLISKN
ncbi:MAG: undecaprenyldiphospho-muramoylpentapeptide beta-N-acetylglucosaminyltransferase [Cryomorphaceae bacterium]